jgi:Fe-S cluster assembly protein SufD
MTSFVKDVQIDPFERSIEDLFSNVAASPIKAKAWTLLQKNGLASKRLESFTYVPLRDLYASSFQTATPHNLRSEDVDQYILRECKDSVIVFVDGMFSMELSKLSGLSCDVNVVSLQAAERGSYSSYMQNKMKQRLEVEQDPFAILTIALSSDGAFVQIPPKIQLASPIQCLYLTTQDHVASFPRVHVAVGAHAHVVWATTAVHYNAKETFSSALLDVSQEEGSRFEHIQFSKVPHDSWSFSAVRSSLKKDCVFRSMHFTSGSRSVRQDFSIDLLGEGADAHISGLSWLEKNDQSHIHASINHKAPHCTSHQFFKGILTDVSHSSFTGKIAVSQIAQKTQAYQLNNNLLLSEGCIAYSKPGLEILADDVKASHGATVSQIDEEQLFYLQSRGLSKEVAKKLMVSGFCRDILDKIEIPSIKEDAMYAIENYLLSKDS